MSYNRSQKSGFSPSPQLVGTAAIMDSHGSTSSGRTGSSHGSKRHHHHHSSGNSSHGSNSSNGSSSSVVGSSSTASTQGASTANSSSGLSSSPNSARKEPHVVGSAKVRAMELFKYWLVTEGAQQGIKKLVEEHTAQVPELNGQGAAHQSGTNIGSPTDEGDIGSVPIMIEGTDGTTSAAGSARGPSKLGRNKEQEPDPQILIGMDDLPAIKTTQQEEEVTSPALGSPGASNTNTTSYQQQSPTTSERSLGSSHKRHNRTTFSPHKSPREVKLGTLTSHMVDEVDAAHMRGALSPRSLSPAAQLNQDLNMHGASPFENSLGGGPSDGIKKPPPLEMLSSISRHTDSSQASSRSTSPSTHDEFFSSRASSVRGDHTPQLPTRGRSSSASFVVEEPKKPKFASYSDVPRFYFAEGKPQTTSTQLEGPHYKKHENPHLVIHEGVAIPLGGGMVITAEAGQPPPNGPRMPPMLPLGIMEDEDVGPFIQREFATLPQPPTASGAAAGRKGSAFTKSAGLRRQSSTRSEAQYQQQLFAVMRRIVTQAFGLPGYFTKLVMSKVTTNVPSANAPKSPVTAGIRPGTSGQANATIQVINMAAVKEFYEKHLRFKSIVRRMFEVLIVTSKATEQQQGKEATSTKAASGPGGKPLDGAEQRRNYLVQADFSLYLEVLLDTHPGLGFLRQTTDFQLKYLEAVLVRIFYDLDRHDRGKITWPEFEASKLPDAIRQVDVTEDINAVLNYFSYEHFYVLYCRFWELDDDKDLMLGPADLVRYGPENSFNPQIVQRIFQGCGRKLTCDVPNKMNFEDFVWFCLSEEDKSSPRSIRYWFRILDADGDGIISGCELETYYNFTKDKLIQMTTEAIGFGDVICQIKDMLPTMRNDGIRLEDLLKAPQSAHVAINMICNVVKFLQFEQRDPFVAHHDRLAGGFEKTEWDRFARLEYDRMASEADEEQM